MEEGGRSLEVVKIRVTQITLNLYLFLCCLAVSRVVLFCVTSAIDFCANVKRTRANQPTPINPSLGIRFLCAHNQVVLGNNCSGTIGTIS